MRETAALCKPLKVTRYRSCYSVTVNVTESRFKASVSGYFPLTLDQVHNHSHTHEDRFTVNPHMHFTAFEYRSNEALCIKYNQYAQPRGTCHQGNHKVHVHLQIIQRTKQRSSEAQRLHTLSVLEEEFTEGEELAFRQL